MEMFLKKKEMKRLLKDETTFLSYHIRKFYEMSCKIKQDEVLESKIIARVIDKENIENIDMITCRCPNIDLYNRLLKIYVTTGYVTSNENIYAVIKLRDSAHVFTFKESIDESRLVNVTLDEHMNKHMDKDKCLCVDMHTESIEKLREDIISL